MAVKDRLLLAFVSAALAVACGCSVLKKDTPTTPEAQKGKIKPEKINTDISNVAQKFQVNFFKAIESQKRDLIAADLIPEMQEKFTAEKFKAYAESMQKSKGKMIKSEYMGCLHRGLLQFYMWKVTFENDLKKTPEGKDPLPKDILFTLMVGQVDGKYKIFNWIFQ